MLMRQKINQILCERPIVTIPKWLCAFDPDLLAEVKISTAKYSPKNLMESLFIIMNGPPPKCKCDNYRKFNTYTTGYRIGCKLGNKCLSVLDNRTTKQKITLMDKFGVSNAAQLDFVKTKIKNTNLKKYGTEHHSQNSSIKEKTAATRKQRTIEHLNNSKEKANNTNLLKYGVTHHMKLETQQEKVKNTNLIRYQHEYPLQNAESLAKMKLAWDSNDITNINKKRKQTLVDRYGVDAASKIPLSAATIEILSDKTKFCDEVSGKERKHVVDHLGIHEHTLYLYAKKYDATDLFARPLISQFEKEVSDFLTQLKCNYITNNRHVIAPYELDFYVPNNNLAIECCGLYWHAENSAGRTKNYHYNKFNMCKEKGITLLTIFEDEWNTQQEKIKNKIGRIINNNTSSIYARKTSVKEVDPDTAKFFIDKFHIQSYTKHKIALGIFHNDELCSIMTFDKPRYSKKYDYEIVRFCSSKGIIGGASKLLSYFIKHYTPKSIVSYNDNRYFNGDVYKKLNFVQQNTNIGYYYTDYKKRYSRLNFQKHKLVEQGYDKSKTEWQIIQELGFDRIWDCGQTTWVLHF